MSLLSIKPRAVQRMSNALLCCRLHLPRSPEGSTHHPAFYLRHNPINQCAPTDSTYQSVRSPMAQPPGRNPISHWAPTNGPISQSVDSTYQSVPFPITQPQKPRVLFDLVNEPTIRTRCPLYLDPGVLILHTTQPLSNIRLLT
jgi:hypothetical protein